MWLLQINGAIGPASADHFISHLNDAESAGAALFVLELDTPGGLDHAMRDMIKVILGSRVPVATYVAPSGSRAASAGTYLMYARHIAAMAPATNIGSSTPVSYSPPPVSSRSGTAVNAAMSQLGVPYKYATSKPGVSFDCSGLTGYAWEQAGVYLPHQSRAQYASIPHVSKADAQSGDLIFFYSPISHVSIYLGNGMQVHAPNTGSTVSVAPVNWGKVTGVGRPG